MSAVQSLSVPVRVDGTRSITQHLAQHLRSFGRQTAAGQFAPARAPDDRNLSGAQFKIVQRTKIVCVQNPTTTTTTSI